MRPSTDPKKEAERQKTAAAIQKYLNEGGTIKVVDSTHYKREGGTLSKEQVIKTFAYQSQIGKIKKEHQGS